MPGYSGSKGAPTPKRFRLRSVVQRGEPVGDKEGELRRKNEPLLQRGVWGRGRVDYSWLALIVRKLKRGKKQRCWLVRVNSWSSLSEDIVRGYAKETRQRGEWKEKECYISLSRLSRSLASCLLVSRVFPFPPAAPCKVSYYSQLPLIADTMGTSS